MRIVPESELTLRLAPVAPKVSEAEFRRCRNDIVRALARFGSVGPSGVHDEHGDEVEDYGRSDSDFFVVDDMYSDEQRLHLVETDGCRITDPVLEALSEAVARSAHWAVHVAIGDAGLYVFPGEVAPCGRRFWDCGSISDLARRCAGPVDFGPPPAPWEEGYEIWRDLISGSWQRSELPVAPDREWEYVLGFLSRTSRISEYTYRNRLIHDFHPVTRLEFVSRWLDDDAETSEVGMETVALDAGHLLAGLSSSASVELLERLAKAQLWLRPEPFGLLWTNVIHGFHQTQSQRPMQNALEMFLRAKTQPPNAGAVALSALLGLACLKDSGVAELAVELSRANPHWHASVHSWLQTLRANPSDPYPPREMEWPGLETRR